MIFVSKLKFYSFQKNNFMLIKLLVATLSPLGLIFSNSILGLLAIQFFLLSYSKIENKIILDFYFFVDFQLNFQTKCQKPQLFLVQKS